MTGSTIRSGSVPWKISLIICSIMIFYYLMLSFYYVVRDNEGDWWLHMKGFGLAIVCSYTAGLFIKAKVLENHHKSQIFLSAILLLICFGPVIYSQIMMSNIFRPSQLAKTFDEPGTLERFGEKVTWRPWVVDGVQSIEWNADQFEVDGCGGTIVSYEMLRYRSYIFGSPSDSLADRVNLCVPVNIFHAAKQAANAQDIYKDYRVWGIGVNYCPYENPSNSRRCIEIEKPKCQTWICSLAQ